MGILGLGSAENFFSSISKSGRVSSFHHYRGHDGKLDSVRGSKQLLPYDTSGYMTGQGPEEGGGEGGTTREGPPGVENIEWTLV